MAVQVIPFMVLTLILDRYKFRKFSNEKNSNVSEAVEDHQQILHSSSIFKYF